MMLEGARDLAGLLVSGAGNGGEKPCVRMGQRDGAEPRAARKELARVGAAIAADMTGESESATGAIALLERPPDPGAITLLDPDEHTPWGAARVDERSLKPSGLALVARSALVDVGQLVSGWKTREHPFEGGSDHVSSSRRASRRFCSGTSPTSPTIRAWIVSTISIWRRCTDWRRDPVYGLALAVPSQPISIVT